MLEQRALHFPIRISSVSTARRVLAVAADLAQNDFLGAERRLLELDRDLAEEGDPTVDLSPGRADTDRIAPTLRARALARVLRDLATHGWAVLLEAGQVFVRAPAKRASSEGLSEQEMRAEKQRARSHVAHRVREQLQRPSTRRFIANAESLHCGADAPRSIRSLIADGPGLAKALRERGPGAVRPYLQVADNSNDSHTGLRLMDVYRYFRYFWSFPYYSTPGRTLPLLVRDAGQPNHPVCGLLCLASPVPKLTARDTALGLTPAWLEGIVAAIEAAGGRSFDVALGDVVAQVNRSSDPALSPTQLLEDLRTIMRLKARSLDGIRAELAALGIPGRAARARGARQRLVADLVAEVEQGIRGISLAGFGFTHAQALRSPLKFIDDLRDHGISARKAWRGSRSLTTRKPLRGRRDAGHMTPAELRNFSEDPLFRKKRVVQLASLLGAWADLEPLRRGADGPTLSGMVFGHGAGDLRLGGGADVAAGLRTALAQRLSRLMASQVVDVVVCGALPPYGPLLGGKLAALLALSGEVAQLYFAGYERQVSDIKSKMAGKRVRRPADLVAITTTSFFSVGSSQYNRVRLPETMSSAGWRYIGLSAGHGTMHFSLETTELIQTLLKVETGQALITSEFGEGPSERMRKVRDGLVRLGLPADDLLLHGSQRRVYLANLSSGETKPGLATRAAPWRRCGPRAEEVAAYWRDRWLGPRLTRQPQILADLENFRREDVLLSRGLEEADQRLTLLIGGGA